MTTLHRHGLRYTLSIILIATVYFGAAKFGFLFTAVHGSVTLLWPPTGIALAIILLFGQRFWPGIALGAFLANALTNGPISFAFFPAVGNTLEAVVGAYLLQPFGAVHFALDRTRDVISLRLVSA